MKTGHCLSTSVETREGLPILLSGLGDTCVCSSHSCTLGSGLWGPLPLEGFKAGTSVSQRH